MTPPMTRDQFVERARYVPKNLLGLVSAVGYVLLIGGVAGLIIAAGGFLGPSGFAPNWSLSIAGMLAGVVVLAGSSWRIQRRFHADARAAGYSDTQVREIEDEAERLNAEED